MYKILNIAFRIFPDEFGGSKRFIYQLNNHLVKQGHISEIITVSPQNSALPDKEVISNITVYRLHLELKKNLIRLLKNIFIIKNFCDKFDFNNFDYIFIHHAFPAVIFLFLFNPNIKKKIICFHYARWSHEFFLDYIYKLKSSKINNNFFSRIFASILFYIMFATEKYVMSVSKKIIVLSEYSKKICITDFNIDENKIIKFKAGIDVQQFFSQQNNNAQKVFITLLTIRRLESRMGLDNFIKALNILNRKNQLKNIKVIIAGDGSLKNYLENLVMQYNLKQFISFIGYISEDKLSDIYHNSDIFVLPTLSEEGFGIVLLESILSGCIAIGTNIGSIPELLSPISNQLIISGTSAQLIAEKILDIISLSEEEKNILRQKGIQFIKNNFDWEKIILDFIQILDRLDI